MVYPIKMRTPTDVTRISNTIANTGIPMYISCGNVYIDARSVLGLFALVGKPVLLVAPDGMNPDQFIKLAQSL